MKCAYCGFTQSRVVDSRQSEDGTFIRRRRACEKCGRRFTTYERVDLVPLMVIKKNQTREDNNQHSPLGKGISPIHLKKHNCVF